MMKRLLSILSILLLFTVGQGIMATTEDSADRQTIVTEKDNAHSFQEKVKHFELCKSPNAALCLTNRVQQTTEYSERLLKTTTRLLELSLQKEQNTLNKISEITSITHTLKCSSLRIRAGHWVYVLRKIII